MNVRNARRGPRDARTLRRLLLSLLLIALVACSDGPFAPLPSDTVVFSDPATPSTATPIGAPLADGTLTVVLGLERDDAGLAQRIRDMATPGSAYFRKRQAVADTAAEFGARPETIDAVTADLARRGLGATPDVTRGFIATSMTVAQASDVFGSWFATYQLGSAGAFVAPASAPVAPREWQGHVREVVGLSTLPPLQDGNPPAPIARAPSSPSASSASTKIHRPGVPEASGSPEGCTAALALPGYKPNQLRTAYGIDALRAHRYLGQGVRMALVEDEGFAQSDVDAFADCYGIDDPVTPTVVLTGSLTTPLPPAGEPTLDIEITLAVAPRLDALYVFQANDDSYADKLQLYAATLDPANTGGETIHVLSSSIGSCELLATRGYVDLMEHVLMTAAAANVSVFASSGDSGSSSCFHHDEVHTARSASYPATSAYATAVGGTNLLLGAGNALVGSSVWNDVPWNGSPDAGGGGPSIFVAAPAWQTATGTGETMRTTPDVAFFSDFLPGYTIFRASKGGWYDGGGTSAATPLLAASSALIRQALLAEHGVAPAVAHEWISGLAASESELESGALVDVTLGDNDLFGVGCCTAGPGYDQASGWGSLDVAAAAAALAKMPRYHVLP